MTTAPGSGRDDVVFGTALLGLLIALLSGEEPQSETQISGVASTLVPPVLVTKENINDAVVEDGYWSISDICTEEYAEACAQAGLS